MRIYILWVLISAFGTLGVSAHGFAQATKRRNATAPAEQAAKGTTADEAKLIGLEKQDWEVTKKKDWKALDKLLSPDFVWVDDDGIILGRNDFVEYFANVDLTDYAMEDVKVTFFNPDVALVTYKVTEKGSFKGEQLPSKPYYVGSGYLKRTGKWLNIYTQTTLAH
jgi:Domain of unknown function (DUF4440)